MTTASAFPIIIRDALRCDRPGCQCQKPGPIGITHCPAHQDAHPSLSVTERDGRVLVRCMAGCTQQAVIEALRARGLWPSRSHRGRVSTEIAATYDYQDERGALLFQVVRFMPKAFRQRRPDGAGGWVWDLNGVRPVPYRLREVLAAVARSERLFITEGEKDADRLAGLGVAATTNPGGAGKWRKEYTRHFTGARAVILADNDDAGKRHVEQVAQALHGIAAEVKVLHLLGLPPKGDVSDWLDAGHTAEELMALAEGAPRWEPPSAPDLATLLRGVTDLVERYVVLSGHQAAAVTLWAAHTHALSAAEVTPYLAITSPEKRSGKTRLLEVLELLVARPWRVVQPSEAVLFRKVAANSPTLLLDETDAIFKDRSPTYEGLRALLNAGNRRGTTVARCVGEGKRQEVAEFPVFCPKALAGIGGLPDTVADRAIPIRLTRRAPHEQVARFRHREAAQETGPLRGGLARWAFEAVAALRDARADIPDALNDRAAEGWEPLLAIADLAGGDWPARAREAAVALHADATVQEETAGVALLAAIQAVFDELVVDRIATVDLLRALVERDDGPWAEWWGKAIAAGNTRGPGHRLKRLLRPYNITSRDIRTGDGTRKGFLRTDFEDAFSRYLPPLAPQERDNATTQTGLDLQPSRSDSGETTTRRPEPASGLDCRVVAFPTARGERMDVPEVRSEDGEGVDPPEFPGDGRRAVIYQCGRGVRFPKFRFAPGLSISEGEESWRTFCQRARDEHIDRALAALERVGGAP